MERCVNQCRVEVVELFEQCKPCTEVDGGACTA